MSLRSRDATGQIFVNLPGVHARYMPDSREGLRKSRSPLSECRPPLRPWKAAVGQRETLRQGTDAVDPQCKQGTGK
jgi:hypothetical protein